MRVWLVSAVTEIYGLDQRAACEIVQTHISSPVMIFTDKRIQHEKSLSHYQVLKGMAHLRFNYCVICCLDEEDQ